MKKFLITLLLITSMLFIGCEGNNHVYAGKKYESYGMFNVDDVKSSCAVYRVNGWSVAIGIVFVEFFLISPIYEFGYNVMEPIGVIPNCVETLKPDLIRQ